MIFTFTRFAVTARLLRGYAHAPLVLRALTQLLHAATHTYYHCYCGYRTTVRTPRCLPRSVTTPAGCSLPLYAFAWITSAVLLLPVGSAVTAYTTFTVLVLTFCHLLGSVLLPLVLPKFSFAVLRYLYRFTGSGSHAHTHAYASPAARLPHYLFAYGLHHGCTLCVRRHTLRCRFTARLWFARRALHCGWFTFAHVCAFCYSGLPFAVRAHFCVAWLVYVLVHVYHITLVTHIVVLPFAVYCTLHGSLPRGYAHVPRTHVTAHAVCRTAVAPPRLVVCLRLQLRLFRTVCGYLLRYAGSATTVLQVTALIPLPRLVVVLVDWITGSVTLRLYARFVVTVLPTVAVYLPLDYPARCHWVAVTHGYARFLFWFALRFRLPLVLHGCPSGYHTPLPFALRYRCGSGSLFGLHGSAVCSGSVLRLVTLPVTAATATATHAVTHARGLLDTHAFTHVCTVTLRTHVYTPHFTCRYPARFTVYTYRFTRLPHRLRCRCTAYGCCHTRSTHTFCTHAFGCRCRTPAILIRFCG